MRLRKKDDDRVPSMLWAPGGKITPYSFGVERKLVPAMLPEKLRRPQTAALSLPPHPGWEWRKTTIPQVARKK